MESLWSMFIKHVGCWLKRWAAPNSIDKFRKWSGSPRFWNVNPINMRLQITMSFISTKYKDRAMHQTDWMNAFLKLSWGMFLSRMVELVKTFFHKMYKKSFMKGSLRLPCFRCNFHFSSKWHWMPWDISSYNLVACGDFLVPTFQVVASKVCYMICNLLLVSRRSPDMSYCPNMTFFFWSSYDEGKHAFLTC